MLRELVPEARIAVAHGQMHEHQLEQVMVDFWERDFDVLVCTTIVESGLDVANANTLIVDRADRLRPVPAAPAPRPGRPGPRARLRLLPVPAGEAAHRDRPRPAGHDRAAHRARRGHARGDEGPRDPRRGQPAGRRAVRAHRRRRLRPLRTPGGEAVAEYRGEGARPRSAEVKVELPIDAHLPHDYVTSERLRLEAYKRIAEIGSDADVDAVREELVDRYGRPPPPVENLLEVARFRVAGPGGGLTDVTLQGQHVRFGPVALRGLRSRSGSNGCTRRHCVKQAAAYASWCRVPRRHRSADSRCATSTCSSGARDLVEAMFLERQPVIRDVMRMRGHACESRTTSSCRPRACRRVRRAGGVCADRLHSDRRPALPPSWATAGSPSANDVQETRSR